MSLPRLTIGVPVYNGAATLRKALAAIDAQTFRDFKVVIADNASTDGTAEIIADFARSKDNVSVISRPETVQPTANFRPLAMEAETEFFIWLADDDWWEPDYLKACIEALDRNPDARCAFTHFRQYFHFNGEYGSLTAHVPSLSWDRSLNAIIRGTDMAPCSFYGVFRSWDIKETLRKHNLEFDFSDVFLTLVMALRGQMEIVPRDLFRTGVRSEAAMKRTSLGGSALQYRPFLKTATRLFYGALPKGRATLAAVNLWWRVRELRRHHAG